MRRHTLAAFAAATLGMVTAASISMSVSTPPRTVDPLAVDAAHRFLKQYVEPDGRVVRRDQGDDTVSEGQAYGMLLAVAVGSEDTFRSVWTWTARHLQRPDGLLSWRWANGTVTDTNSAADADLDAARALVLGGERFDDAALTAAGVRLGQAILDRETVSTPAGRMLTAGPWTAESSPPWTVNPSYASPVAAELLHAASGDARWIDLAAGDRAALSTLLAANAAPPDWAAIDANGHAVAMPAPGSAVVASSYDAARVPPRYAESCNLRDRRLAASLVDVLQSADRFHAVAWVAVAAAEAASGEVDMAQESLRRAVHLDEKQPTYYGAAWIALGAMMLVDIDLGGCPPLSEASVDGLDDG